MDFFSDDENLEIGENYLRSELCEYMNIVFTKDIEKGVYKPRNYSSIIFFSTIDNNPSYPDYPSYIILPKFINGKLSDTKFIFSSNRPDYLDPDITVHQYMQRELLLFVRIDQETGFYYFGRCKYLHEHNIPNYPFPLYCLELLDTRFSDVKGVEIPDLSK